MTQKKDPPMVDAEEVACRLLLHWPVHLKNDDLPDLKSLAGLIAGNSNLDAVRSAAKIRNVALFLDEAGTSGSIDGMLFDFKGDFDANDDAVHNALRSDIIIGALCGTSRHTAMVAGELGADYVLFGDESSENDLDEIVELVTWWRDLFILPVGVIGLTTLTECERLHSAGVDFLTPAQSLWQDPSSAKQLIVDIDHLIAS